MFSKIYRNNILSYTVVCFIIFRLSLILIVILYKKKFKIDGLNLKFNYRYKGISHVLVDVTTHTPTGNPS